MSAKSRRPKATKARKGTKGRKGGSERSILVESEFAGPPFGIIVLIATVLSMPTLMHFVDGTVAFDTTVLRFLAALTCSWILVHLVYAVAHSFPRQEKVTPAEPAPASAPRDPNVTYRGAASGPGDGAGR